MKKPYYSSKWAARYNLTNIGAILKMTLCIKLDHYLKKEYNPQAHLLNPSKNFELSEEQHKAYLELAKLPHNKFSTTLLDGVTGSGKTSVYLSIVYDVISRNKTSIDYYA